MPVGSISGSNQLQHQRRNRRISFSKSIPGLCEGLKDRQATEHFIENIKTCDATIDGLQNAMMDSIGLTWMAFVTGTIFPMSNRLVSNSVIG